MSQRDKSHKPIYQLLQHMYQQDKQYKIVDLSSFDICRLDIIGSLPKQWWQQRSQQHMEYIESVQQHLDLNRQDIHRNLYDLVKLENSPEDKGCRQRSYSH